MNADDDEYYELWRLSNQAERLNQRIMRLWLRRPDL
jgi:hypothetical protein